MIGLKPGEHILYLPALKGGATTYLPENPLQVAGSFREFPVARCNLQGAFRCSRKLPAPVQQPFRYS